MCEGLRGRFGVLLAFVGALGLAGAAKAGVISVHWAGYDGSISGTGPVTGTQGVVPAANWNNLQTYWQSAGPYGSLLDDSGNVSTAAANGYVAGSGSGTCYWYGYFGTPPVLTNNVIMGPGGSQPIVNLISGIPLPTGDTYEIIAYVNTPAGGTATVWLDSNPASPSAFNAPAAGITYYYTPTGNSTNSFVPITNTDPGKAATSSGNYVIFSGLTGSTQAIWMNAATNSAINGFQIVGVPEPGTLGLLGAATLLVVRRRNR